MNVISCTIKTGNVVWVRGDAVVVKSYNYCWRGRCGEDREEDRRDCRCRPSGRHAILKVPALINQVSDAGCGGKNRGRRTCAQSSSRQNQPLYQVGGKTALAPSFESRPGRLRHLPIPSVRQ